MAELQGGYDFEEEWFGPVWQCGACETEFMMGETMTANYCPKCGGKV